MFLIGGNPASNHPRLMRTLMTIRRRGGEVIVINPVVETGLVNFSVPSDVGACCSARKIASLYVQPHIGGDLALLTGIAKRVVETRRPRRGVPRPATPRASPSSRDRSSRRPWDEIDAQSRRRPRRRSTRIADAVRAAKNVVFSWTMGITHHVHGVENVQAIANLALLRGMVGRPHAGLMPIRGHSNVQGIGSVGVTPKLKEAIFDTPRAATSASSCRRTPGLDTMACMEAADRGEMKVGVLPGRQPVRLQPRRRRSPRGRSASSTRSPTSTRRSTRATPRAAASETLILPVLPATKSRSRRRRSRCSTTCA